jgi:hypothetical protein
MTRRWATCRPRAAIAAHPASVPEREWLNYPRGADFSSEIVRTERISTSVRYG